MKQIKNCDPLLKMFGRGFIFPNIDRSMTLSEAVKIATEAVEKHIARSPVVRAYIAALPKGSNTDCPDSSLDELVKYFADQKGIIDKSDPALTLRFLKKFIIPAFEFERLVVSNIVYLKTDDISDHEVQMFRDYMELARATDDLWAKWFEVLVVPYQSLNEIDRGRYNELVREMLSSFDYTVFDLSFEKGIIDRRTWAEAFPKEIKNILKVLDRLKERVSFKDLSLKEYFEALSNAYSCTDITQLEELWTKVDQTWVSIPRTERMIPVHGMESGYEHSFGVSPEFRLEIRTQEGQKMIDEKYVSIVEHTASFELPEEIVLRAKQKMERTDVSLFVPAIRSGVCVNFRYAGQAVPNRQQVVEEEGGRIFLDMASASSMVKNYTEKMAKYCHPETAKTLIPLVTDSSVISILAGHEYSHAIGCTAECYAELGSDGMKLCEEAKATLLGILADEYCDPSSEHRLEIVASIIGRVFRFLADVENETVAPYVRENLVSATTLFETGVISLSLEGVVVDIEKAKSSAWFDALREFNHGVLNVYQTKDKDALNELVARYCNKERPEVAKLIAWVNGR